MIAMILIFSGRIGRNINENQNNNNNNEEDGQDDYYFSLQSILNILFYWWRGHRVHALVVASIIAFSFQVGLMSFFYQVLWVEREALMNAWVGRGGNGAVDNDGGGERDGIDDNQQLLQRQVGGGGERNNGGGVVEEGGNNDGAGNRNNLAELIAGANPALAVPQAAVAGGIIRRGPNNGGFFHDVMCLVLSFLMSLIPAWKPDQWADPVEDGLQQHQHNQPGQQQAVEGAAEGNDVGDNAE